MILSFKVIFLILASVGTAFGASVDCPERYPNGNTMTYSDGTINFANGNRFRYSDGTMNYPNGNRLRYSDGTMNYENGNRLMYSDGTMNYENGNRLRYSDGTLNDSNGNRNTTGAVAVTTKFGDGTMRIVAKKTSATFRTTLSYGKGIVEMDISEDGSVSCTVEGEGDSPETEFRVDGVRGSAFVTVKPGQDARQVKAAVQAALD